ncbi:hypothetical protein GQ42DRAFT_7035 [Ramicandelaber brevisporus]|nr:hypothetical protein GQ42DRAFT_7035 [Ramicandelaber brevisporus]
MIKESIPPSSLPIFETDIEIPYKIAGAIDRLKSVQYANIPHIKYDLEEIQYYIGDPYFPGLRSLAANNGLVEAVARAMIVLHSLNKLDEMEPVLKALHLYVRDKSNRSRHELPKICLNQVHKDLCKELDKKLEGITDHRELENEKADILYRKQRLLAMVKYASQLCEISDKLSATEEKIVFRIAAGGIGSVYPPCSTIELVDKQGKLTLVVKPRCSTEYLYFDL